MTLKVGDMVICHHWDLVEGKKGFIEEIVTDPNPNRVGSFFSGKYSVYGLQKVKFSSHESFYYGDFLGEWLEPTGEFMTILDLEKFRKLDPENKGLQHDIEKIQRNLGRDKGRNEPVESIFNEVNPK